MENHDLRFLYWNTLYRADVDEQMQAIHRIDDEYHPDYYCLSEVSSNDSDGLLENLQADGWETNYRPTTQWKSGQTEGIAFVSRYPVEDVTWRELSRGRGINGIKARNLGVLAIQTSVGELNLATTHKSYPFLLNRELIRGEDNRLLVGLPPTMTVLGGDFNTTFGANVLTRLEERGWEAIKDPVKVRTFVVPNKHRPIGLLALDHVYSTPDIADKVTAKILTDSEPSNHRPILVTVHDTATGHTHPSQQPASRY